MRSLTSSEVSRALGVSSATIQRHARAGKIPYDETPGGHRRFDLEEVRAALKIEAAPPPRPVVVIVTALMEEAQAVRAMSSNWERNRHERTGTRYYTCLLEGRHVGWRVILLQAGQGNLGAAVEATRAIEEFDPALILFVGVAGGIKDDIQRGDVVVADRVCLYQVGKAADEFAARAVTLPTNHALAQLVQEVAMDGISGGEGNLRVHLKPIAAGDQVITSRKSAAYSRIRSVFEDAVAVDMESAGLYEAGHRAGGIPSLAIRGISDSLVNKTAAEDARWQPVAAANASAVARALLEAATPDDINSPSNPQPSDGDGNPMARLPPPTAAAVAKASPSVAERLTRVLGDLGAPPPQRLATAQAVAKATDPGDASAVWEAVAEFAAAHGMHAAGADAFVAAATDGRDRAYLLARAALLLPPAGPEGAARFSACLGEAEAACSSPADRAFVALARAAAANDPEAIISIARPYPPSGGLAEILLSRAHKARGEFTQAIDVLERLLRDHPGSAFLQGGIHLELATLHLARAASKQTSSSAVLDLESALDHALRARDVRRQWLGPSGEAAALAVQARASLRDFRGAVRLAELPPLGEATVAEMECDELASWAVVAALTSGDTVAARRIASRIQDSTERLILDAECSSTEGRSEAAAALFHRAAESDLTSEQRMRVCAGLVDLGEWPVEGFDGLREAQPAAAAMIEARALLHQGDRTAAIRLLRQFDDVMTVMMLVDVYLEAGRRSDAVALLESRAATGRFEFALRLASIKGADGDLEGARLAAQRVISGAPVASSARQQARRMLVDLALRTGDWQEMVREAELAIREGDSDDRLPWAVIGGHFNLADREAAADAMSRYKAQPTSEDEARLAIELIRTSGPCDASSVIRILDIVESFPPSEALTAHAFAALAEVSRELDLPKAVSTRAQDMTEAFFTMWPESELLRRFDIDDLDSFLEHVKGSAPPPEVEDLLEKVIEGQLPYGMLAAVSGRSIASLWITKPIGWVAVGTVSETERQAEEEAAMRSLDSAVVTDSSALYVGLVANNRNSMQLFSQVRLPREVLDDVQQAFDQLKLESTSTMGWDTSADRPTLFEVEDAVAQEWHELARDVLTAAHRCHVVDTPGEISERNRRTALLSSLELARSESLPLWTDDPVMRRAARSVGVAAFGTLDLMRAQVSEGLMTREQYDNGLIALLGARLVDGPWRPDLIATGPPDDRLDLQALALTRPWVWADSDRGLKHYRQWLPTHTTGRQPDRHYVASAALGAARSTAPSDRVGRLASVALVGFVELGLNPISLPDLLAGVRSAAHALGQDDPHLPLMAQIYDLLTRMTDATTAAQQFTLLIGELSPDDRNAALTWMLDQ